MKSGPQADKFGKLLITKLRDSAIDFYDGLARGHWKVAEDQDLQTELARLTEGQRATIRRCVVAALDCGLHDFLFALNNAQDSGGEIAVVVDGQNVAKQSDGLHGELYGQDGWIARFGKHPA
jgi:hypothetical protein